MEEQSTARVRFVLEAVSDRETQTGEARLFAVRRNEAGEADYIGLSSCPLILVAGVYLPDPATKGPEALVALFLGHMMKAACQRLYIELHEGPDFLDLNR